MKIIIITDTGKQIGWWKISRAYSHNVNLMLKEYSKRSMGKSISSNNLLFANGLWEIPENNVNEVYREIVKAYSKMTKVTEGSS